MQNETLSSSSLYAVCHEKVSCWMLKRETEEDCLLGKKNSVVNGRGVNPSKGKGG